ncbi:MULTISPECIES: universal stress protein [Mycobacterium]|uniref:Universal stress protein n=1 Tax=Mycobacterium kiyosense TaxID=2871094 RepID=A0A9P3Q956_9MYCO|nr:MULTISPECIES: universal stress protein [Mycobacterium]BDB41101.1 universal stress protein [Mycobacterium kiyosense]BDE12894.1 universal stress protein [Mycobacterium sp. 20KCMC460]GLB85307.1 universal stress protein [Mycobacterium kiyosense]GLB92241.1 universal stress protein [Mycobacterium kiyosense]GLB98331.1 universal stress protein [Mycobacterium kiyosense]
MRNLKPGPAVVVGVDGSRAAVHAAVWAVDEAASRDIPLRLVCVVDPMQPAGSSVLDVRQAAARSALYDAYRAVEATGTPVKVETEILWGKPLNKLMAESRSATMICVGSMGINHARCGKGSVAGALAGAALCPVAVIHRAADAAAPQIKRVVAEVDNGAVLRHAFEEARLRGVPLRAISVCPSHEVDTGDGSPSARAQLDRRLARWTRLYPDVRVESKIVRGHATRYMAEQSEPGQLFVTDTHAAQVCSVYNAGSSVLTVRCGNL